MIFLSGKCLSVNDRNIGCKVLQGAGMYVYEELDGYLHPTLGLSRGTETRGERRMLGQHWKETI